jgi:hypothetical protein
MIAQLSDLFIFTKFVDLKYNNIKTTARWFNIMLRFLLFKADIRVF